ncbi:Caspase domain-containing hypothetical protein [Lasiodiplodia theobromae]|uniref:Caspase domain-containing hypothetical protein n=1 Tax=Lasiodiplodia theobromae TaxID=45133 RepID=UPI0015C3E899|nr:Caspase domain-containing hypothetical protein [Lasiodiplodia theobromae]KAF4535053.1 Caspase domain-containing hypothetical protein [Lasiodiplodia theobromae]
MCAKRALLVGSPYGDLKGTANDVRLMAQVLKPRGFTIVERLGDKAGRESILASWDQLIQDISSEDDAVVVYYSGHGGLVEVNVSHDQPRRTDGSIPLQRHQFIVPSDYDDTETGEFNGILTEELTDLLRKTTDKTKNVTLILDCCHSGRMARDPQSHKYAKPRFLSKVAHAKLTDHLHQMLENKVIERREDTARANPYAVRIVAAATSETAWEYMDERGEIIGAFTKSLAAAISEDSARVDEQATASWNTAMQRVRELVTSEFCGQHPQVEGPSLRGMFSTELFSENTFLVKEEDGEAIIQAGRVAGVKEDNVYHIPGLRGEITTATVRKTTAFKSLVSLDPRRGIAHGGQLAYLHTEARHRWPVSCPSGSDKLGNISQNSKFLRLPAEGTTECSIAQIDIDGRQVRVLDSRGIQIF